MTDRLNNKQNDWNHRDIPLTQIPGYLEWSRKKLRDGVSEALIAHLDASSAWLCESDAKNISPEFFEELLEDLESQL